MPHVDADQALSATIDFWTGWSAHAAYQPGPYRDAVDRSLITLKALTYEPTGGIVAAATTSLPEEFGGVRNWDYRYCWLRDATYTLQALLAAGYRSRGRRVARVAAARHRGSAGELQILYSLDGARRLPEADLPWLSGYEGSSPVRTGNAASGQVQLDVWGETLGRPVPRPAGRSYRRPRRVDPAGRPDGLPRISLARTGQRIVGGTRRPAALHALQGHGVGRRRPDGTIGTHVRPAGPVLRWEQLRDQIHQDVVTHAFDAERNTFTQAYGSTALDASLLLIPRIGFLPATDPRVMGTINAVRRELSDGGLVKRYQTTATDDGLKGSEGLLHRLLVLAGGRAARGRAAPGRHRAVRAPARSAQRRRAAERGMGPGRAPPAGQHPQAFSHFALIISALQLHMGSPARSDNPMTR